MEIKLSKPFARNGKVDEFDVRQMKKALNRLGYYVPYEKTGITGIPDAAVFTALTSFQTDQGFAPTGTAKPGDDTVKALNREYGVKKNGSYIWRTTKDSRVRESHAALNGTVRDFADSPDPGEEFNCRCWVEFKGLNLEPLMEEPSGLHQEVVSAVNDADKKWDKLDFYNHARYGGGKAITLSQTGYLRAIIEKAREIMFHRVEAQVANEMRKIKTGKLVYTTERSYPEFRDVFWVFGGGTVRTKTEGVVSKNAGILSIEATVSYEYYDIFTDIMNIRQGLIYKTSDPNAAPPWVVKLTDFGTTYYRITDHWTTRMRGSVALAEKN